VVLSLEDPAVTGFDYLANLIGSERTRYVRGSIYDLDPDQLGVFDMVICFGVIYHLRYSVLGIDNLRRIAGNQLFLESQILDNDMIDFSTGRGQPLGEMARFSLLQFYQGKELYGDSSNWFSPSMVALIGLIETTACSTI
jgi:tRNA (mo5U34)-methyltransferase